MAAGAQAVSEITLGRYVLYDEIAAGGMATVHLGRVGGAGGFARTVAIKRLHPHYARDPEFTSMFMDEARIVSRIHHANVVQTLDVESEGNELFLVMEYVHGESLAKLLRTAAVADEPIPLGIVSALTSQLCRGLHAAHDATDEEGHPLNVVHRDVSPQNVLVGADGIARVIDFGVAKAASRTRVTRDGTMRGKLGYMSPEHVHGESIDRRSDVFAAGVVLWELLSNRRLFEGETDATLIFAVLTAPIPPVPRVIPPELAAVVKKALEREPGARYQTALELSTALEDAIRPASIDIVAAWVEDQAGHNLRRRAARLKEIEAGHARWSSQRLRVATPPGVVTPLPTPASDEFTGTGPVKPNTGPVTAAGIPKKRPAWMWALLAVPILFVGVFAVTRGSPPPAVAAAPSASSPVTAKDSTPPIPPPEPESAVPVEPTPAPVESTPPPAPLAKPSPIKTASGNSSGSAPKRPPNKKPDCSVPYWVDPQGIHHPKPECL